MVKVAVISDSGTEQVFEPNDSSFALYVDGVEYSPVVTTSVEVESNQQQQKTGTQCGDQRVENTSKDPFKVRVEGIVTNSPRPNELTTDRLLFDIQEGDELTFTCDISNRFGAMKVSNVLIRQETDLVSIQRAEDDEPELAFRFQIQFGEENNE